MTNYDEMTTNELQVAYQLHFQQRYPDESLLIRRVLKLNDALKKANARIAELESLLRAYDDAPQEPTP